MPTVPSSFVPQADMQGGSEVPLQAPGVEPVRNLAADQQVQMGQAMTRAGNVAWNVGSNIQDAIDEASAKAADVQFLQSTQQILNGQNGYMNMQGVDAESNFQAVNDAMIQSASGIADGLKNDTQKQMFKQAASRNLLAFQGQVLNHRNKQVQVLAVTAAEARTNEYVGLAVNDYEKRNQTENVVLNGVITKVPVGSFNANVGVAMAEVKEIGRLQGFAENSAQMKELETKVWSQVATGVTNRLMVDGKYQSALTYVKDQIKAGHLDTKTADSLLSSVDANRDREIVYEKADSIKRSGLADSVAENGYELPIKGAKITINSDSRPDLGIQIDAAPGTPVQSPFDGKVTMVETVDGNTTIGMTMNDGTEIKMSGLANGDMVEVGQDLVVGEQVSIAGEDPMGYTMKRNGKSIDPRNANHKDSGIDRESIKPPATLREALKQADDQIENPTERESVKSQIRQQYSQEEALNHEEYLTRFNTVQNLMFTGNNIRNIDPELFGGLSSKDQAFFRDKKKTQDDLDFQFEISKDPSLMNVEYLKANAEKMSTKTYIGYLNEINSKEFASKQAEASFDAGVLNVELINNGLADLVDSKDEDKKRQYLILSQSVKQEIYVKQKDKGRLSPDEKREIIQRKLLDRASVSINWGFDIAGVPVAAMTAEELRNAYYPIDGIDIPAQDYALIVQAAGAIKLSDQEIAQAYKQMKAKK